MTPERRERIEQLCEAALDRDASVRAAFLAHACAGDEALRREVESLLAHEHAAEHFIGTPALQSAAESLAALADLAPGEHIGSYEVVSLLGSGGMGDVYRARDPQLARDVAIKVLPPIFSTDPERMIRFEREARVLASLNHPNIGAIYGLGHTALSRALVLELVEGPTLADRLRDTARHDGSGLALPDALAIGRQIASALEAAHEKGIVHRDLKPANIKITPDGTVKVLDFGLAKLAVQAEDGSRPHGSHAPGITVTSAREGVVLGTAAYMSPEQARGQTVDKRTDIWAFGCVLYEMLTGGAAFARETVADTMGAVVNADPDWSRLPADTPKSIRRLLRRCLRKPREGRLRDIGDAALEIEEAQRSSHADRRKVGSGPRRYERRLWAAAARTATSHGTADSVVPPPRARFRRRGILVGVAASVVAAALLVGGLWWRNTTARVGGPLNAAIDSLAILPLVNGSGDADMEFLSDGLTEELINRLSQLPGLRVMARTTVFRYKNEVVDPQEVGRALQVQAVVTGRVTRRGDAVSVQLDLVNTADGSQLWGEQFRMSGNDVDALHSRAPGEIAERLQRELTGDQARRLAKGHTQNVDAYQLYLRGRHLAHRYDPDAVQSALKAFQEATVLDPNYAPAYSGIADAYSFLGNFNHMEPGDAYRQARAAALKALDLDDELAEAHVSLGWIRMNHDWDWLSAEKEYQRALSLNPGSAAAHSLYAWLMAAQGRLDAAIDRMRRTLELDPLSVAESTNFGWYLLMARRYDAGVEQIRKTLAIDPTYAYAHEILGRVYEQQGRYPEAITHLRVAVERSRGGSTELAALGHGYAAAGRTAEARGILEQLQQLSQQKYVSPYNRAVVYAGLKDLDQTFVWLERAYQQRDGWLAGHVNVDPRFDVVRPDPRFDDVLRRIGLR